MKTPRSRSAAARFPVSRTVVGASGLLLALGLGLLVAVNGCEEQSSTPPSSSKGGNQIGLSENPNSLLGKSAKTAKDVASQVENKQEEAVAMADEMSGEASKFELAGLAWAVPTSWKKVPPSSGFIAADYRIEGEGGEARVTLSHFPGQNGGGGVDANVERWASQFQGSGGGVVPYPKKRTVAGCEVTLVTLEGTMKGGMPGGPATDTPNYELRGALVEGPDGMVVIKLTGPKATVDAASQQWDAMIEGMTRKGR